MRGIVLSIFYSYLGVFLTRLYSLSDRLSTRLLWLSMGVILAVISGIFSFRINFFWWWLLMALVLRFRRRNLLWFYFYFEIRLIPILLIVLRIGRQPERLSAGSYLLFYTTFISVPYLSMILLLRVSEIVMKTQILLWRFSGRGFVLLIPFFIKMPMFGFHFWLPKAHVEASTRGSIVLAGMLLKLGRYGAARVVGIFSLRFLFSWASRLWILLALFSRIITFIQRDLKKIVAYRRVTHITFIIVGITTGSKMTLVRVTIVSLAHGWAAIGMFLLAGTVSHSISSRLGTLSRIERSLFWLVFVFGLLLVSNAGIPPIPSFFPEVFIVFLFYDNQGVFNWGVFIIEHSGLLL